MTPRPVKSAKGLTSAVGVSEPGRVVTEDTVPTGTPGTYGRPPTEPNVTSSWPALSVAFASNRVSLSGALPDSAAALPDSAPIWPLPAILTPTVVPASVSSWTVAVFWVTETTVPTRPSPLRTVSWAVTPSLPPTLIVTVSE